MHFCIFDASEAKNISSPPSFSGYIDQYYKKFNTCFFCADSMLGESGQNVIGRQHATELNQLVLFFFHPFGICASELVNCNKTSFYLVKVFYKQMTKTA